MSYSFSARGATKAEVLEKAAAEFDKVVASQPVHAADRAQALSAVDAFLGLIPADPGDKDFIVYVSGSLGWSGTVGQDTDVLTNRFALTSASVNVSASMAAKETA